MPKALIDVFDIKEVIPYLRERDAPEFLTESILPPLVTESLEYEHLIGQFEKPIIGSFSAFGANNVFIGRDAVKKFTEELQPIRLAIKLDGKLFVKYRNAENMDPLVQALFDDVGNTFDGVRARAEAMRVAVLTTGQLVVNENGVKFTVDYGVPAEQRFIPTTLWNDPAADPIQDMLAWREELSFQPDGAIVSRRILQAVLRNANVRTAIFGEGFATRSVAPRQLNAYLAELELPIFVVDDDKYRDLQKVERKFWPDNRMVWVGRNIGRTVMGPTEESTLGIGIVRAENGIYVQAYEQPQPAAIITTSSATAMVALPGAHELAIIQPLP